MALSKSATAAWKSSSKADPAADIRDRSGVLSPRSRHGSGPVASPGGIHGWVPPPQGGMMPPGDRSDLRSRPGHRPGPIVTDMARHPVVGVAPSLFLSQPRKPSAPAGGTEGAAPDCGGTGASVSAFRRVWGSASWGFGHVLDIVFGHSMILGPGGSRLDPAQPVRPAESGFLRTVISCKTRRRSGGHDPVSIPCSQPGGQVTRVGDAGSHRT